MNDRLPRTWRRPVRPRRSTHKMAGLIGIAGLIAATGCGTSVAAAHSADAKVVTFAIGGPFTGDAALDGQEIYQGASLAANEINAAGGIPAGPLKGAKISLVKFDDKDDPQTGVIVARDAISNNSILAYVGSALSDVSVAQAPFFERAQMPFLSVYASANTILQPAKNFVFVVPPTFDAYSYSIADTIAADHIRSVGVIHLTGTYGELITQYLVQRLHQLGVPVVADEAFNFGDTDFRAQLARIKAGNPRALAMVGLTDSDTLILKQAGQLGLNVPAFDPGGIDFSQTFLNEAGALANGLTGNTPTDPTRNTPATHRLVAAWKATYGTSVVPDPGAFAWAAIQAAVAAIEAGGTTRESLARHLHSIYIPDTSTGPLSFAPDGARIGAALWIYHIEDGAFKFLDGYEQKAMFDVARVPLEE
jgi:branched-chain amino acid transport system substrate-binding protein